MHISVTTEPKIECWFNTIRSVWTARAKVGGKIFQSRARKQELDARNEVRAQLAKYAKQK